MHTLFNFVIRVPKKESSFTYFILEANEGLCFYSTLDWPEGVGYRDIDIRGTMEFKDDVLHLLEKLGELFPIEYLKDGTIRDQ